MARRIESLASLDGRFYNTNEARGSGVIFNCPVHRTEWCFFGFPFDRPLEGTPENAKHLWARTGDTIETLTLSPSLLVYRSNDKGERVGTHWHGFIRAGMVETLEDSEPDADGGQ